jgi:hypothetical protein
MSDISSIYTDEEVACFHYLDQVGCFSWTLVVKVKACSCFFHPHPPEKTDNTIEYGSYEIQAEALADTPMSDPVTVNLYFHTKDPDKSRLAQEILQAGQVLLVRCTCWCLHAPITLYIDNLEQLSRLPPEHEQVVSALIDKTSPYQYSRRNE